MKDIADRISAVVVESMAAKRTEVEALVERVRSDIDSLQRALSTFPGTAPRAAAKRAPSANGRRRRRRNTQAVEKAESSRTAPSNKTATKRTRREKRPEERAEISKRMTAYWQRKREEKASK